MIRAPRSRSWSARAVTATWLLGIGCTSAGGGPPIRQDLGDWQLEYGIAGGVTFNVHALTISRNGELKASDTRLGDDVTGQASGELLAAAAAFLKTAREAKKTVPVPDGIEAALVLTSRGQKYDLQLTRDLRARLEVAWDAAVSGALIGSWRQSGWKLCTPAAQLSRSDMDTPIDDLTFRPDGTFGLMWRGGGAHTGDIPHVPVAYPDYNGDYTTMPSTGSIRMRSTSPLVRLRDFSGDGRFRVNGTELTLMNIWLGTRDAPKKPDICELTFTRK